MLASRNYTFHDADSFYDVRGFILSSFNKSKRYPNAHKLDVQDNFTRIQSGAFDGLEAIKKELKEILY